MERFPFQVDRCNVMRGDRQSCQVGCVSPLSLLSPVFYNGDKCVCVCACTRQFPVNGHKVSDCWVSVCEGRAKSWGSERRNRGEAEDGV